jgi:hypothetical protein
MGILLLVLAILALLFALIEGSLAKTIFQQIDASIGYVISSILLSGACIVNAINKLRNEIKEGNKPTTPSDNGVIELTEKAN